MSTTNGWIGVDLDGTLAEYDQWRGIDHIGSPIIKMVSKVKEFLSQGIEVRIVTARVSGSKGDRNVEEARSHIERWTEVVFGQKLQVTNEKDFGMIALYDDRAVRVRFNTGEIISEE